MGARRAVFDLAGQLPLDQLDVEVEEVEGLELIAAGLLEELPERVARDRPAAEPGDYGAAADVSAVQRHRGCSVETIPPRPTANAFSRTTTREAPASAPRTSSSGKGRNDLMPRAPTLMPLFAHLVDDVLDRPQHRSEGHDDRLGALRPVAADQPAGGAAEVDREALGDRRG